MAHLKIERLKILLNSRRKNSIQEYIKENEEPLQIQNKNDLEIENEKLKILLDNSYCTQKNTIKLEPWQIQNKNDLEIENEKLKILLNNSYGIQKNSIQEYIKKNEECLNKYYPDLKTNKQTKNTEINSSIKKKKKISSTIKKLVWNIHIGESIGKSKCTCCKSTDITQMSFNCGHIIAEANGGDTIVSNLKPICQNCNSSMGTKNMNDFIKTLK